MKKTLKTKAAEKGNTKIKTAWDLTLLYKNSKDPQIEKDVVQFEKLTAAFEKKYKTSSKYLKNPKSLAKALFDLEVIRASASGSKSMMFYYYTKDLDSMNQEAESALNRFSDRLTKADNRIIFFKLTLGKIPKKQQVTFLKDSNLKRFHYHLTRIFENAKYKLSEPEEKILNLKSLPSYSMWVQGQEKLLNVQTVKYDGKQIPIAEAQFKIRGLPLKQRRSLHNELVLNLKGISHFAGSEINAIYTNKKINDELRGLKEPYSATIIGHQNDEKSVMSLVASVTNHFHISHRFHKLKAKLMKLPHLEYADRGAGIGKRVKKIAFNEQLEIIKKVFSQAGPRYRAILDSYLTKGQIDAFPKKGKTGGAYCSGNTSLPTFVLLNDVGTADSLMTFGHEMGHAFHTELSKSQPPMYQHYSIAVAEVASTLFENFVFEELFQHMTEQEKIAALHDRIQDDISTVFRQIACFNFELELHRVIRKEGSISKENIAAIHNKHMQAYLGPAFKLKEIDGYMFVSWSHIRNFFYVYSYAYGQLISKALYKRYKKDKNYMKQIETFLSAGGSKSPEDIFKDIGIDTSKPAFFVEGLKTIEEDIKRLEKLTK